MTDRSYLQPGDRPDFLEGWFNLAPYANKIDIRYLAVQSLCQILDLSHQAVEQLGHSYRAFKVGAAVLAYDEPGQRTGIYFGGNYTPYEGAEWNCAEKRALEVVQKRGFGSVLAIAVSGPPYHDELSGVDAPTCQPCHRCRGMLAKSRLTTPATLVATTNLDESVYELHTMESLNRLHETGQPQPLPDAHPLLPVYWDHILTYDATAEKAEVAMMGRIAQYLARTAW